MVADTVRDRQQFKRKIKGLTSMGRMSAYTLVGLPFFVLGAVTLLNAGALTIGPSSQLNGGEKSVDGLRHTRLGRAHCVKVDHSFLVRHLVG